jgi:soluble lytic murein transglycosylase-like protein
MAEAQNGGGYVQATGSVKASGKPEIDKYVSSAAQKYGLDENVLRALIIAESNYNPRATSPKGARGLMQLMPGTARDLGVSDAYDPAQNIDGGARYFKQQLDRFGSVELALAAYNAGPGAVEKYNGIPPYRETQKYVEKIMRMVRGQ